MMLVIEQRKSVRCLHARWTEMGGAETVAGAESEPRARCALGGLTAPLPLHSLA